MIKKLTLWSAMLMSLCLTAHADPAYPSRAIKLVVPFTAGGITDSLARVTGERVTQLIGQPIVVDNRAGAGGNIGVMAVSQSEPDGYTILLGTQGTQVTNQYLYKGMKNKPDADFTAVQGLLAIPNLIVANATRPYKTMADLVEYAKRNPGIVTYSSAGVGTGTHLAAELFQTVAGVKFRHVPYKGSAGAIGDLVAGNVDVSFDYPVSTISHIKSGRLVPLAITGQKRIPALPEVPTLGETGFAKATSESWLGIFVPRKTPPAVAKKIETAFARAIEDEAVRTKLSAFGGIPLQLSGAQFEDFVNSERKKWKQVVDVSGAMLD